MDKINRSVLDDYHIRSPATIFLGSIDLCWSAKWRDPLLIDHLNIFCQIQFLHRTDLSHGKRYLKISIYSCWTISLTQWNWQRVIKGCRWGWNVFNQTWIKLNMPAKRKTLCGNSYHLLILNVAWNVESFSIFFNGIDDQQEFASTCNQRHQMWFTFVSEMMISGFQHRIVSYTGCCTNKIGI